MSVLTPPQVLTCYFDDGFSPHLAAMALRWPAAPDNGEPSDWELPGDVRVAGRPPEHFGLTIHRWQPDAYAACLLWDSLRLSWAHLTREQLLRSALQPILTALGGDLLYHLDQAVRAEVPGHLKES